MRWTYSDHHFVQNSFVWYKPTLSFFIAVWVFSRKWVRKGASECQSRHDVLLPQAPRIRDWTIQDSNRVSFQNPLDLLHLYPANLNTHSHCRWTKGVVESHSGITDQIHPLFFRNYTPLIKNNTSPSLPSPWAAQVSLPSPSLHHPGNWSLSVTGVAVVLRLQSLWKSVGWALYTDTAKDRAIELQSLCLWVQAMRFDASIHWRETLDLNGAAWLCSCLA